MATDSHTAPPSSAAKLLTVEDVADILGCGRTMVYALLGRGEIGHIKIGRLTRIHPAQVDLFVRRRLGMDSVEPEPSRSRRSGRASQAALTLPLDS